MNDWCGLCSGLHTAPYTCPSPLIQRYKPLLTPLIPTTPCFIANTFSQPWGDGEMRKSSDVFLISENVHIKTGSRIFAISQVRKIILQTNENTARKQKPNTLTHGHGEGVLCINWAHSTRWVCGRLPQNRWTESGDGSQSQRGSRAAAVVWPLLWLDED